MKKIKKIMLAFALFISIVLLQSCDDDTYFLYQIKMQYTDGTVEIVNYKCWSSTSFRLHNSCIEDVHYSHYSIRCGVRSFTVLNGTQFKDK